MFGGLLSGMLICNTLDMNKLYAMHFDLVNGKLNHEENTWSSGEST